MIALLRGRVTEIRLTSIIVDVSGVGYEVKVAPDIASGTEVGREIEIATSLVVREDSWTLYGFRSSDARSLFEELQSVTGVGPKVAHSLLAFFRPDELRMTIGDGDLAALEKVPGIGKKVASRIVLELKDKYGGGSRKNSARSGKWRENLSQALVGLGYSQREADSAIDAAITDDMNPSEEDLAELLKRTLTKAKSGR
jgi:Holliday junction DNA helicase RuvA